MTRLFIQAGDLSRQITSNLGLQQITHSQQSTSIFKLCDSIDPRLFRLQNWIHQSDIN